MKRRLPRGDAAAADRRSGAALVLLTLMLVLVVIPMVGFAVDGGLAYMMQTRLSAAVDSAALAGARSLSVGLTLASQTASAQATVNSYLNANFPSGIYGTTNFTSSSSIQETTTKTRTVSVTASVTYPMHFLEFLGIKTGSITASGEASRRDVNLVLTMDRSGSMQGTPCSEMILAAQSFAQKFTNGRDRMALITFKSSANLDYPPTLNFMTQNPSIVNVIGEINCAGGTGSAEALWMAYQQILAVNEPGALNLIVYFTDGQPDGISAHYQVKSSADVRYDSFNTSTLVNTPASPCQIPKSADGHSYLDGVLDQAAPDGATLGYTVGLMSNVGTSISVTSEPMISAPGCTFSGGGNNWAYVRRDIAYIPTVDSWGNSVVGYMPVDTYPAGNPYQGQMRVDEPIAVVNASTNAADSAGQRIRSDTTFSPTIYCIGLGGDGAIDGVFLKRVANDPGSSSYNPAQPTGLYVYSPDSSQLADAFNSVASQILRLAQ